MAGEPLKDILQEWCIWLLKQGSNDAASDAVGGSIVDAQNRNRTDKFSPKIWFIPGTWGMVGVPARKIRVSQGTQLFIVAASSHATSGETPAGKDLKKHAEDIDSVWLSTVLAAGPVGGRLTPVPLKTVTTDKFKVNIDPGSPYRTVTGGVHGNNIEMVTVGRVALYDPQVGQTRITIAGQSPETDFDDNKKERQYNVHVDYVVTVPP